MEEFSSELKKIRGDLSFREMGEKTGLSHAYLVQLEQVYNPNNKKVRLPSPKALRKISNAFHISYIALMIKVGFLISDDISEIKNYDKGKEEFVFESELKKLRGDLSFREMAKKTGLSHTYLFQLEQNPKNNKVILPSPNALRKIANAFHISYVDLMINVGYLTADDISEIRNYNSLSRRMA